MCATITLHGTASGYPVHDRLASAATVGFSDDSFLLIDSGEGCSAGMIRDGVDLQTIKRVVISHTHADHWSGLPRLVMGWVLSGRTDDVELYVPPGTSDWFREMLLKSWFLPDRMQFALTIKPLSDILLPDGWVFSTFETSHLRKHEAMARQFNLPYPAYGFVLKRNDVKVVFSQDVGSEQDVVAQLNGVTHLICESTHVDPSIIVQCAREHGVGFVVFTHIPFQGIDDVAKVEGVEVEIAMDGFRLKV